MSVAKEEDCSSSQVDSIATPRLHSIKDFCSSYLEFCLLMAITCQSLQGLLQPRIKALTMFITFQSWPTSNNYLIHDLKAFPSWSK